MGGDRSRPGVSDLGEDAVLEALELGERGVHGARHSQFVANFRAVRSPQMALRGLKVGLHSAIMPLDKWRPGLRISSPPSIPFTCHLH